eukprot:10364675-Heterocapsa_arctica.AAC.1
MAIIGNCPSGFSGASRALGSSLPMPFMQTSHQRALGQFVRLCWTRASSDGAGGPGIICATTLSVACCCTPSLLEGLGLLAAVQRLQLVLDESCPELFLGAMGHGRQLA